VLMRRLRHRMAARIAAAHPGAEYAAEDEAAALEAGGSAG